MSWDRVVKARVTVEVEWHVQGNSREHALRDFTRRAVSLFGHEAKIEVESIKPDGNWYGVYPREDRGFECWLFGQRLKATFADEQSAKEYLDLVDEGKVEAVYG